MTAPRRWPLFVIASPAAVAVWSGWVGLGALCGFGVVHPLPGIADGFTSTPRSRCPSASRRTARTRSGVAAPGSPSRPGGSPGGPRIGALALGMVGQVIYHLLAAAHATRAPWPVVVLVSCLPVVTLGFGAALTHLLRSLHRPRLYPPYPVPYLTRLR